MSNEKNNEQVEAIVELLEGTEFSMDAFSLDPVEDEDGNIKELKFTITSQLLDKKEENKSALQVIEEEFINPDFTFKEALELLLESENEEK
ncbi:hypothetical protein [Staphylococcus phage SpP]